MNTREGCRLTIRGCVVTVALSSLTMWPAVPGAQLAPPRITTVPSPSLGAQLRPVLPSCRAAQTAPLSGVRGATVTVIGTGMDRSCRVLLVDANGEIYQTRLGQATSTQLPLVVPTMPFGPSHILVFSTRAPQFEFTKVAFTVDESPPALHTLSPVVARPGEIVKATVSNVYPPYTGYRIRLLLNRSAPQVLEAATTGFSPNELTFQVPPAPGGATAGSVSSTVQLYRQSFASDPLDFTYVVPQQSGGGGTASSPPCPQASYPGYTREPGPDCALLEGHAPGVLKCDQSGYFCCTGDSAFADARCGGNGRREYAARCCTVQQPCRIELKLGGCFEPILAP